MRTYSYMYAVQVQLAVRGTGCAARASSRHPTFLGTDNHYFTHIYTHTHTHAYMYMVQSVVHSYIQNSLAHLPIDIHMRRLATFRMLSLALDFRHVPKVSD